MTPTCMRPKLLVNFLIHVIYQKCKQKFLVLTVFDTFVVTQTIAIKQIYIVSAILNYGQPTKICYLLLLKFSVLNYFQ